MNKAPFSAKYSQCELPVIHTQRRLAKFFNASLAIDWFATMPRGASINAEENKKCFLRCWVLLRPTVKLISPA